MEVRNRQEVVAGPHQEIFKHPGDEHLGFNEMFTHELKLLGGLGQPALPSAPFEPDHIVSWVGLD